MRGAWRSAVVACAALAAPAFAQDEDKALLESEEWKPAYGNQETDEFYRSDRAYLLLESAQQGQTIFMKLPGQEELDLEVAAQEAALARATAEYVEDTEKWERMWGDYRQAPGTLRRPDRPEEPSEFSGYWDPFPVRHMVRFGGDKTFNSNGSYVYLAEVPAGEYVFYGTSVGTTSGFCLCMGTVKFEIFPGEIAVMQVERLALDPDGNPYAAQTEETLHVSMAIVPPSNDAIRDNRLPPSALVYPDFKPVERMPNWFGVEINRLLPMEGVFTYERDRIVDLTRNGPVNPDAKDSLKQFREMLSEMEPEDNVQSAVMDALEELQEEAEPEEELEEVEDSDAEEAIEDAAE